MLARSEESASLLCFSDDRHRHWRPWQWYMLRAAPWCAYAGHDRDRHQDRRGDEQRPGRTGLLPHGRPHQDPADLVFPRLAGPPRARPRRLAALAAAVHSRIGAGDQQRRASVDHVRGARRIRDAAQVVGDADGPPPVSSVTRSTRTSKPTIEEEK